MRRLVSSTTEKCTIKNVNFTFLRRFLFWCNLLPFPLFLVPFFIFPFEPLFLIFYPAVPVLIVFCIISTPELLRATIDLSSTVSWFFLSFWGIAILCFACLCVGPLKLPNKKKNEKNYYNINIVTVIGYLYNRKYSSTANYLSWFCIWKAFSRLKIEIFFVKGTIILHIFCDN